jgi:hypothetical protein
MKKDNRVLVQLIIMLTLVTAIIVVTVVFLGRPAHADGPPPPPPRQAYRPGVYPTPVGPQASPSCLMVAQQMGYLTGRREIAYSNTEACMYFTGARGAALPYGFYGPYVPSGWIPLNWAVPLPPPY